MLKQDKSEATRDRQTDGDKRGGVWSDLLTVPVSLTLPSGAERRVGGLGTTARPISPRQASFVVLVAVQSVSRLVLAPTSQPI